MTESKQTIGSTLDGAETSQIAVVTVRGGKMVTDSRNVAAVFGKRHEDVLRAIRYLECSEEFTERNFAYRERELQKYLDVLT